MTNKKLSLSLIVVGVVLLAAIIINITSRPQENPNKNTNESIKKVKISEAFEVFLHAPLWIAYDKGFFKEEGLDVDISIAGGDEKAWAAVVKGEADFAVGDPLFVAISGEKGQPGKVVASILNGMPFWGIAKKSTVPKIEKPADLNGYSVATLPAPSTNYALQKEMFERAGLEPNIREVAFGGLLPALYAGEVDIALEWEPNVSKATQEGYEIVYAMADYYPEFAFTGLTTVPEYIENNRDTVQKVVNALQKANTFIRENTDEAAILMAKRFDVSNEIAKKALENFINNNMVTKDTITSQSAWDTAVKVRMNLGDLKEKAPYDQYVITDFSNQAKK